jgi:ABC-type dipeptide/oligopeptide/nickel transport system permease component
VGARLPRPAGSASTPAGWLRFAGGRLALAGLSLVGVSFLVFVILRIVPGDPALLMAPVGSTSAHP